MCMMNYQPVNEYCCPCGRCIELYNSCFPVVIDHFIFGECDIHYCEFCDEDCAERG